MRITVTMIFPLLTWLLLSTASGQMVVAHRGASYDAPENTLAAFRLAWEKGADAIEGDFCLTKDGQIVCLHDETTERTAPAQPSLTVAESTLAELRILDVGCWKHPEFTHERIPTLTEVLATVPSGKKIFVEIKVGTEILSTLKKQLEQSDLNPDQIVIICFDETVIAEARRLMPRYKANWLIGYEQETEQSDWTPTCDQIMASLKRTGATGVGTEGNLNIIDESFIKTIRNAGKEVHVWTVNDEEPAQIFESMQVDSITTDRPRFIRNAVNRQK